ncbi:MAG TPA: hypothetical protein PKL92_08130 [Aquaticitalea sp.]|nr:hypothetical protein [Aquaticitalea sp.]HNU59487.1 hypothetical protein [Aquaticitalea sp.]
MKRYTSFEEIEYDLKRLSLDRQIGIEQLKSAKSEFADSLKPVHWIGTVSKYAWKYGLYVVLKKMLK